MCEVLHYSYSATPSVPIFWGPALKAYGITGCGTWGALGKTMGGT